MKKATIALLSIVVLLIVSGFSFDINDNYGNFDINNLKNYQKQFECEEIDVCAYSSAKTYMDYRATDLVSSRQYQFIHNNLNVDRQTGFLYDEDGFIAVALGSYYGTIGDRYYFTLDSGVVLPLVKAEHKADEDTDYSGCYQKYDKSIMEFVIDSDYAADYFGNRGNGLVLNGNYNNYSLFEGEIIKIEKVLDEPNENLVTYSVNPVIPSIDDIFNYASGY